MITGFLAFALLIAPLIGLVMGAVLAPLTVLLAVTALSSIVIGLTKLSRTRDFARRRWLWLVCGLASGAAAGTALPFELVMFGIDLPGTAISGGITGMICALVARRIMRL